MDGIDTSNIEKILREKHGWDYFPLPNPLLEHRPPRLEWELELANEEEIKEIR